MKKTAEEILTDHLGHEYGLWQVAKIHDAMIEYADQFKPKWVPVSERLPEVPDEDYVVAVRNKNKEGGIWLIDIGNFTSDGIWVKSNTWEEVVYWMLLPEKP